MNPPKRLQLDSIRMLRGLAVLLVLLSHLMSVERKYAGDRLLADWMIAGFSGVDLFFGISGFIMVYVTWKAQQGWRQSAAFLLARAGRIYPLYWLVSFALLLVWLQAPELVFASEPAEPNILRSFLLWPEARVPLLPVGWTLIHEVYFYLVFAAVLLLPHKFRWLGFVLWIGVVAVGFMAYLPMNSPPALPKVVFSALALEFIAGAIAAYAFFRWQGKGWKWCLLFGVLGFIAANIWALHDPASSFWGSRSRAFVFAPFLLLLIYAVVGWEKTGQRFARVLVWVGDQSYSLYLTHLLTLSLLGRIWALVARPGIADNVLALPILVMGSLLVGQLTFIVFEKPMLAVVKNWRARL
ncbi:hypothetical protein MNBD_ALPHA06-679 [hydrothermal vent metagenome]|uniref:Acyltransferase 3 domain-containing protein n=1 Tax=hydrothermal vent metagenome TaxID=652676 RepID=A0A3B0RT82_9ZZZZ